MTVIDDAAARLEARVIADRRDIHQNPELGNREFRTSKLVAGRLQQLGIETRTAVAHTGEGEAHGSTSKVALCETRSGPLVRNPQRLPGRTPVIV